MRAFKTGAFELARQVNVPVVPIVIRGTSDALPKHGFVLQGRHHISVTVLPAVPTDEVAAMDTATLTEHVRQLITDEQQRVIAEG